MKKKPTQPRDKNILMSYQKKIKMQESTVKSKKEYSRKQKHKLINP